MAATWNEARTAAVLSSTGAEMPLVGLGTWKIPREQAATAVREAIEAGYRLIDMAADYGNEKEVGEGIRAAIANGTVRREELFVTSKLWNTNHAERHVRPALEKTLADSGLEYVDLYLIHFPISLKYVAPEVRYPPGWFRDGDPQPDGPAPVYDTSDDPISGTWRGMESLVEAGLARNIGVSNFTVTLLLDLLRSARVRPAVNQVEAHPYLHQRRLVEFCHRSGVHLTAYSSFGPTSYEVFGGVDDVPKLLTHPEVARVAAEAGKTPAQVLLRWSVQQGVAVIPKSSSPARLAENLAATGWSLTDEQLAAVSALHRNLRFNDPANYLSPPLPIFD